MNMNAHVHLDTMALIVKQVGLYSCTADVRGAYMMQQFIIAASLETEAENNRNIRCRHR